MLCRCESGNPPAEGTQLRVVIPENITGSEVVLDATVVRTKDSSEFGIKITNPGVLGNYNGFDVSAHISGKADPETGFPNREAVTKGLETSMAQLERLQRENRELFIVALKIKGIDIMNAINLGNEKSGHLLREIIVLARQRLSEAGTIAAGRLRGPEVLLFCEIERNQYLEAITLLCKTVCEVQEAINKMAPNPCPVSVAAAVMEERNIPASSVLARLTDEGNQYFVTIDGKGNPYCQIQITKMENTMESERKEIATEVKKVFNMIQEYHRAEDHREKMEIKERIKKQLGYAFQMQRCIRKNELKGVELLIRFNGDEGTPRSPQMVVEALEAGRIISPFFHFILEDAAQDFKTLQEQFPDVTLSLNASPTELSAPRYVTELMDALEANEIDPSCVTIEITETNMDSRQLQEGSTTITNLKELVKRGCTIAIDDFQTGVATIERALALMDLGVVIREIKIDKEFLDPKEVTYVQEIVRIARKMGKGTRIIAEGVEDENLIPILREYGVDVTQGYFNDGRPAEMKDIIRIAKRQKEGGGEG